MTLEQKLNKLPPQLTVRRKGDVDDYVRLEIHKFYYNKKNKTYYWVITYSFGNRKSIYFKTSDDLEDAVDQMLEEVKDMKIIFQTDTD